MEKCIIASSYLQCVRFNLKPEELPVWEKTTGLWNALKNYIKA